MPQFRYRAVTPTGEIVVGEVDAPSREEVVRRIEYLGHLTIEAELATAGILARSRKPAGMAPRSRDVSIFLHQLALLLGAGLTLEAALQTLSDTANKGLAGFANGLRASISAGDSFAEALEQHTSVIEPAYVAMVRAGEASGKLDAVLRAIVEDRSRKEVLTDRVNSAIRYPLFLVGSAIVIMLFFLIGTHPAAYFFWIAATYQFFMEMALCGSTIYVPEVYPLHIRVLGASTAMGLGRIGGAIGSYVIGACVGAQMMTTCWLILGGGSLIAGLATIWLGVEPKGQNLEQLTKDGTIGAAKLYEKDQEVPTLAAK